MIKGSRGNRVLGYGAMTLLVAFIIYEYLATAIGVNIRNGAFEVSYPFIKRNVPFSDIEDILLRDEFIKGNRTPLVLIVSKKSKKPFKLKQIGVDSNVLYKSLRKAARI